jgi:para-nitrobenzyl esterase
MHKVLILAFALTATPVLAQPAPPAPAPAAAVEVYNTVDTPIGTLIDDPAAKAIIEKYVPGMTTSPQIDMARTMSLKDIQTYAADTLTDDVLKKIDADLAALGKK